MMNAIGSSLSGLRAFGIKMAVHSNNVANVESEEFKKSRTLMEEGEHGGVQVEIDKIDDPGPVVYEMRDGERIEKELSNVDLAEEIPQTIPAQRGYEANLTMIKTRDEMLGAVLDIVG